MVEVNLHLSLLVIFYFLIRNQAFQFALAVLFPISSDPVNIMQLIANYCAKKTTGFVFSHLRINFENVIFG